MLHLSRIVYVTVWFYLLTWSPPSFSQRENELRESDPFLVNLFKKNPQRFEKFLADPSQYEIQVLYTRIDRDRKNIPRFTTYRYQADANRYFYPASTIKLPAAVLALEKLNLLDKPSLDKFTPMLTRAERPSQTAVSRDTTAENGLPSVAHYIRKILLASDNDAYNRLYEFLGLDYFNQTMREKGYSHFRATHRLETALTPEENRFTNPVLFEEDGQVRYEQPGAYAGQSYTAPDPILKGKGYVKNGETVMTPFDFREKNFFALTDQHQFIKNLMFPHQAPPGQQFRLTEDDYQFLYQYMSQLPVETAYPEYYTDSLDDGSVKFLLFGKTNKRIPRHIRSFNKIGNAYGYLIDNAYIVDFEMGVEFLLSAVISCNEDQILNDNRYDYEVYGYQFMADLGKTILEYELNRKRRERPDLSRFEVEYDK